MTDKVRDNGQTFFYKYKDKDTMAVRDLLMYRLKVPQAQAQGVYISKIPSSYGIN